MFYVAPLFLIHCGTVFIIELSLLHESWVLNWLIVVTGLHCTYSRHQQINPNQCSTKRVQQLVKTSLKNLFHC